MHEARILWRRLDAPGHDACRLRRQGASWRLEGSAVFRHENGAPACVGYTVECDAQWRTRRARVRGWIGAEVLDLRIAKSRGSWMLNGVAVAGVSACTDLDLGFSPATNLFQLHRLALPVGQTASLAVAWLDVPDSGLKVLEQRYQRRADDTYWYEAPQYRYAGLLRVDPAGFVTNYPDLWTAE